MTDFSLLSVPGPTRTALTSPFWEAAREGRLVIQHCDACGTAVFYPRALCPHCWSDRLRWRDASGRGRLKSFSVVHRPGHPAWAAAAPYAIGLVELAEGPTLLSHILVPPEQLAVGMPLQVTMIRVGKDTLPFFTSPHANEAEATSMSEQTPKKRSGWDATLKGMPKPGETAERSRTTSMADIVAFTEMTGDRNPLHYDRALAERSVMGKLIVQGGVTSGILNALVAEDLPGPGTVFLGCEWKFLKAVGVDETITGRIEVLTVREDKPICTLKTTVRNAQGDICLDGTATTFTVGLKE